MNHSSLFMKIPDTVGDLQDDMSTERLAEVGELDDLVEKLSSLQQLQD